MSKARALPRPLIGLALCAAVVAALMAVRPAAAISCNGAAHQVTLSAGKATPGSGTTDTAFTFSVTYADNAGCAPSAIRVSVSGLGSYRLQSGGSNFLKGVVFSRTMSLPAGNWAYSFSATSGTGAGEDTANLTNVAPSKVQVAAPTPPPTPVPTPRPTVPPVPSASPPPASQPPATGSPIPAASADASAAASALASEDAVAAGESAQVGSPAVGHVHPATGSPDGSSPEPGLPVGLLAWGAATAGALGLFFYLTGRADEARQPPPATSPAAAIFGGGPVDSPARRRRAGIGTGSEEELPRWLRPSVQAARQGRTAQRAPYRDFVSDE